MPDREFLANPRAIRQALREALAEARSLDMAVAFVGKDWQDIVGGFRGRVRLVCWLSSTNTNPYAVEDMLARPSFSVRQLDAMHAKVYLARAATGAAIVGSANLSTSALSDEEASGQFETAMRVKRRATFKVISAWFEDLWRDAHPIASRDIATAKVRWHASRQGRAVRGGRSVAKPVGLSPTWRASSKILRIASRVRTEDPTSHSRKDRLAFFSQLTPSRMTRKTLEGVIDEVAKWTGHRGAFLPALRVPLKVIRNTFEYAFDENVDLVERLEQLAPGGAHKLDGFGVNAWTLVLHWRNPHDCVPLNAQTLAFLRAAKLASLVGRTVSPASFRRWRSVARELQWRLRLPSLAHVDLLAWRFASGS